MPQAGRVKLAVFDMMGSEVAMLVNEEQASSQYFVYFDATKLPNGNYVCRISVG